jgi:hypothetical protein
MLNASTVAMPGTVEIPLETKQAQETFIYADQILSSLRPSTAL